MAQLLVLDAVSVFGGARVWSVDVGACGRALTLGFMRVAARAFGSVWRVRVLVVELCGTLAGWRRGFACGAGTPFVRCVEFS